MSSPARGAAGGDLLADLVEGKLPHGDPLAERETQHEVGGRQPPRDDDLESFQLFQGERLTRDHDRPVADSERGAVWEERVAVGDARVRPERERAHLEPALERPAVQGLDVRGDTLEGEPAGIDATGLDRPEHEGVVGVCAVADTDGQHLPHASNAIPLRPASST